MIDYNQNYINIIIEKLSGKEPNGRNFTRHC